MSQEIIIPSRALILTVGPAGCGKSTFVLDHFPRTSIVASDVCREMVSDDMRNQECNRQAFDLFHRWIEHRLSLGRLTVADATNLLPSARKKLKEIADRHQVPVIVLEFAVAKSVCLEQNSGRSRFVPEHVIEKHCNLATQARIEMRSEGYSAIYLVAPQEVEYLIKIQSGYREYAAPGFDIVGDIHGCNEELEDLLYNLGYRIGEVPGGDGYSYVHPEGRKLVFLGDITDRGPDSVETLRIVTLALEGGHICVMGNHDNKLMRALRGNKVKMGHGLAATFLQIQTECSESEKLTFYQMLSGLPYQVKLKVPGRRDVIACHAGIPKRLIGKDNSEARNHAIYGEVEGPVVEGLYPTRGSTYVWDWPNRDGGSPVLVHGHTRVKPEEIVVREKHLVFDLDTGCAFGGALTAMRWPEGTFYSVPAARVYCESTHKPGEPVPAPFMEVGNGE